ncbi:MAG: hypothetical protein H6825_12530 [Planctomycetes bacterium]|nr:hypothetical protein [Planctomycetota bacterium]
MTDTTRSSGARPPAGEGQIGGMIALLSDANEEIVARCREALIGAGDGARPMLLAALAGASGDVHRLLRRILAEIDGPFVEREVLLMLRGEPDLERGSILLGRLVDGGPAPSGVTAALDAMAVRVDELLDGQRDSEAVLRALRRVLVDEHGLQGVPFQHARLADALLHGVTSHRRGMPLPLCIAWVLVGRRLGVPIVGVGMPGHMLVRYDLPDGLLVLDPFHSGQTSDEDFWKQFLEMQGFPSSDLTALDASDAEMLVRTLRNLLNLAAREHETALGERCHRILRAYSEREG